MPTIFSGNIPCVVLGEIILDRCRLCQMDALLIHGIFYVIFTDTAPRLYAWASNPSMPWNNMLPGVLLIPIVIQHNPFWRLNDNDR
jgi:hypothetical protein